MKRFLLGFFAIVFTSLPSFCQCLSDVTKILPEESPSAFDAYSNTVAINGDYAVIGSPRNDSLGYNAGLVYIYKKVAGTWQQHAILSAPVPGDLAGFGRSVDLHNDYLVVGAAEEIQDTPQGTVYVYRKPLSGWSSNMTPIATLRVAGASKLGYAVKIDPTGTAIVAGDVGHMAEFESQTYPSGAAYVFRKGAGEWSNSSPYVAIIPDPAKLYFYFAITVDITDQYVFIGNDSYMRSVGGSIEVYKSNGDWSALQHMVTLQPDEEPGYVSNPGKWFSATNERVAAIGNLYEQGIQLYVFEKGTEWGVTEKETYKIQIESGDAMSYPMSVAQTGDQIFAAASIRSKKDRLYVLNKKDGSFQNSTIQTVTLDDRTVQAGAFGQQMDTDGANLIIADPYSFQQKRSKGQALILPVAPVLDLQNGQTLSEQITTTVEHRFGSGFLMKDDYLFVGALFDGHNAALGAVSIYKRVSGQWVYQTKIAPPFNITPDASFGYSITANDNYLAVSAQLYDFDGAVFIFKKKSSWADLELVQTLSAFDDGGSRYLMGHEVALNGNTLVVAAHEETRFKSTVLFYKLENGVFVRDGALPVGNAGSSHRREISFSFHRETLAVGCITSNPSGNLLHSYAFIFEKDAQHKWDTVSMVAYPNSTFLFGYSIKLTQNHLFVGDCMFPANGLWGSGAVMVYTRPTNGWGSQAYHFEPASILTAKDPLEGDLFGVNIDVAENILISGAPQSAILPNPLRENTNPGSTYVIQGLDFNWTTTLQLFRYQGEFHNNSDGFGAVVSTDKVDFVIGAPSENQPDAYGSGAMYIVGMPPSVQLVAPVCEKSASVQLKGYPFDGVWSGPGIVDAAGIFDPQVAGKGVHLLTYKTPNCHFEGKMQLEVKGAPSLAWVDTPKIVCEGQNNDVLLQISADGNSNTYQWFFRGTEDADYVPLATVGPAHSTNTPGSYQVNVNNGACNTISPERVVSLVTNPIGVVVPPVTCSAATPLQLTAIPAGGSWSGLNVSAAGVVNVANFSNGTHTATYKYKTEGCEFTKATFFDIDVLAPPHLVAQGTLCDFPEVNLYVTNQREGKYTYYRQITGANAELMEEGNNVWYYAVARTGTYYVVFNDGRCSSTSPSVVISPADKTLILATPDKPVCYLEEASLQVTNGAVSEEFTWWYKEHQGAPEVKLTGQSSEKVVTKGGYYRVDSRLNLCAGKSEWQQVSFTAADSVTIPNVFTPNDDNSNDTFELVFEESAEHSDDYLEIFNRYGRRVHETRALSWDGAGISDGVYFWIFTYRNCAQRKILRKGYVHLRRE